MNVLDIIHQQFGKAGIRYLVVGGCAVYAYGIDRNTDDVDILIEDRTAEVAVQALSRYGYRERERGHLVSRMIPAEPILPIVDLMYVDSPTMDAMWRDSRAVPLGQFTHQLPSPQHLINMKLHALRYGSEGRRNKDALDIIELARLQAIDLKSDDFQQACLRYGSPEVYRFLLKLAEHG